MGSKAPLGWEIAKRGSVEPPARLLGASLLLSLVVDEFAALLALLAPALPGCSPRLPTRTSVPRQGIKALTKGLGVGRACA